MSDGIGEKYTARILKVATGEIRSSSMGDITWDDASEYWWAEGNYSCDCNRFLKFERAGGREPRFEEVQCGDGWYRVQCVSDSGIILYDEISTPADEERER